MPIDNIMKELATLLDAIPGVGPDRPVVMFVSNNVTAQQINVSCSGVVFQKESNEAVEAE